jgi:hypothetical protein
MKKNKLAFGMLALVFGLALAGCNSAALEGLMAASANQQAADGFKSSYREALALTVDTVSVTNKTAVQKALTAYNGLGGAVKALLPADTGAKLQALLNKIGAPEAPEGAGISYTAIADGAAGITTSTSIALAFSAAVTDLADSDVALTDGTGAATKGALSGAGTAWSLALTGVATQGTVSVSISKSGVESAAKTVAVYKPADIAYSAVANGVFNATTSTSIALAFSAAVTDLADSDVTLTDGTGAATKGALSGAGTAWSLALTDVAAQGTVSVSINKTGVKSAAKTVAVYKAGPATPPLTPEIIADPSALAAFIAANCSGGTATAPKNMTFSGVIFKSHLATVRSAVRTAETYVVWDLSAVTSTPHDWSSNVTDNLSAATIGDTIDSDTDFGRDKIKGLVLPTGHTTISANAFLNCSSLTSITLPAGLATIGNEAFYDCTSLTSVTLSEGLTTIGRSAFHNCTSLTSISLPEGLTSIGSSAFSGCTSLASVTLPASLTTIGIQAFLYCYSLTSITLPTGLTTIGNHTFSGCGLASVSLPEGLATIGDFAFYDCGSLASITFPESLISIGGGAFLNCGRLTSVTVLRATEPLTTLGVWAFDGISNNHLVIYVPAAKVAAYKASEWSSYTGKIQAMP